ncbi:MAG: hypothetical protein RBG13Loki_1387, partial [Promethearchaeota archaeon CR_4]
TCYRLVPCHLLLDLFEVIFAISIFAISIFAISIFTISMISDYLISILREQIPGIWSNMTDFFYWPSPAN